MISNHDLKVETDQSGTRLDRFVLLHLPSTSRSLVVETIAGGKILVNSHVAAKSYRLSPGDSVKILELPESSDIRVLPNAAIELEILHEDAGIIVINKQAGLPVHPINRAETQTLANGLVTKWPELAGIGDNALFPAFVHRLDTETSGVIVAAKTTEIYEQLRTMFTGRKISKTYIALVHGALTKDGEVVTLLMHDPAHRGRMIPAPADSGDRAGGERVYRAVSVFKTLQTWPDYSLVEVDMLTGITHQIRAQLAVLGNPIVGDKIYSSKQQRAESNLPRHFLHAAKIGFRHPATGQHCDFEAPLPVDLQQVLAGLDSRA